MNTTMMHARNNLKVVQHNKAIMEARLIKLNVKEKKSKNRIKEAEKRAGFIKEMNAFK